MNNGKIQPINQELTFNSSEIIVSKTDMTGRLLYANDVFCRLAEMSTDAVIGQPHSIIRHPDMPRCIFKLLWDRLNAKEEIFAYVKNMSKTGRYYWVLAHVTPSINSGGSVVGFHSNRRIPSVHGRRTIEPLYRRLLAEEAKVVNQKQGMMAGETLLNETLADAGVSYDEFIWSLENV